MNAIMQHLPALLIIIPMIAAPLCVIFRNGTLAWLINVIAGALIFTIAGVLLQSASGGQAIHYNLGGWQPPTGIAYYIDISNALIACLVAGISFITALYAKPIIAKEIPCEKHYLFYAGWLLCLTGLLGILITGDAFNVFVFLEISSLATYMLIALGNQRPHSFLSAFRYLIMGSIGASFILLGIGFLYAATGTLNMMDLADRLSQVEQSRTVVVAFCFITIGILIKTAIFPLHAWLPSAYQYAPSAVSAFLAGTSTKVSLYVLIRFYFHIFGEDYSFGQMLLGNILLPAAVIGFLLMSIVALFQSDLKRLLAFSSIGQIGYILAAICLMTTSGVSASLIHIINHGIIKTALFMATGCFIYAVGSSQIKHLKGLGSHYPFTVAAFILGGVSLIGVPLTAGFISKWNLINSALLADQWQIAALILLSSVIAILYIGKIVLATCFETATESANVPHNKIPPLMTVTLWLLLSFSLYMGLQAQSFVNLTDTAAKQLFEPMQPNTGNNFNSIEKVMK